MKIKSVIFLINCITQQRCLKRVQEFIDHGYDVKAYGFERKGKDMPVHTDFPIHSLGVIDNRIPYVLRSFRVMKALRRVVLQHRAEGTLFYAFGLDMALCCYPWARGMYIYEESDLVHAYAGRKWFENLMECLCKRVIYRSKLSVFTSEGFVEYHFGKKRPSNIHIIPNRVNARISDFPQVPKPPLSKDKLRMGFVGIIRYQSVVNLCRLFLESNPANEFHFFGLVIDPENFYTLKQYAGCHFHGVYRNPDDLPAIYAQMDLVVSTYDLKSVNVRYLEPNKLYEAIYFETPIIVSKGSYLAQKVKALNVGFEVDGLDYQDVARLLGQLSIQNITEKVQSMRLLGKTFAVNCNEDFFYRLSLL